MLDMYLYVRNVYGAALRGRKAARRNTYWRRRAAGVVGRGRGGGEDCLATPLPPMLARDWSMQVAT